MPGIAAQHGHFPWAGKVPIDTQIDTCTTPAAGAIGGQQRADNPQDNDND